MAKLLEENLNEKYTKEIESIYVGEQFKLTFEHLNKHAKIINERHVEINNKRVFLGLKYYKSERGYTDFVERKIKKISTITDVFLNQFNNFNNIWGTFKKNNDNYIKVKELKNQCNEFIKTVDLIEKERGEVLSIVPPDNYYLLNVHNALINIYNPLFNFYFDFLNQLGLMIKNPEDERLIKEVENGRHIVKLDFVLSGKELQILNKEINKYINSKKKRCFIATVVYGDINAYEVIKSREWRDNILSKIFLVN